MSWQIGIKYKDGDIVTHDNASYKCIFNHVSITTWSPSIFTQSVWKPISSTSAPSDPVQIPSVPPPVYDQKPVTKGRNLAKLLNGNRPLGAYVESWSMPWTSSTNNHLTNVKHANIVYLSFAFPNCTYKRGQMTWDGTGLQFSSDFGVIRDSIAVLKNRGVIVMLSVGGATYPFDANYNADGAANLVKDLNLHGIDIDWENHDQKAQFGKYISETRRALGDDYAISAATFSVGAYGEGIYANAQPGSDNTGMSIAGLKSNGHQLDWINIMSYDASDAFDPLQAYDAHKELYKGPLLIGAEVPPEAWGGHVITLDKVKQYVNHVKKDTSNIGGLFVWSYNKYGIPNCNDILYTASEAFGPNVPVTAPVVAPITSPVTTPTITTPISELVGKTVLGFQFFQDTEVEWARIDNITLGESEQYSYKTFDGSAGDVLDAAIQDTKVVALLYEWATGKAYSKTGFDLNNSTDIKSNPGFTTFVVKSRVTPLIPSVSVSAPVVETPIAVAPVSTPAMPIVVTPVVVKPSVETNTKLCAPYIDVNNWPPFPMSEAAKATGNLYYTLAFILDDGRGTPAFGGTNPLGWYMDEITKLRAMGGDCIFSFGGANGTPLAVSIKDVNTLVLAYQKVIDTYKCKTLDFDVEGGALDQTSVDRRNQALVILQSNNPTIKINYTLPVMPDGLDHNGIMVIKSARASGLKVNCLNLMCMDYGQSNQQMGQAAISAGKAVKRQLVAEGYPNTTVGLCPMIGKNDTANETFTLGNAKEMLDFAKSTDYISLISFWSMNRDITQTADGIGPLYANSSVKQDQYAFVNIFKSVFGQNINPITDGQKSPATAVPSVNILGKVVLGNTIIQDGKPNWLKIDGVAVGDTFNYMSYNSTDIGGLLDQVSGDPKVAALLYNWKTGDAYTKTGFDFSNGADTKLNPDFTSFIVKDFKAPVLPNIGSISISSDFVKWQNGEFRLNGSKFVPVGLNCYFLGYTEWHNYPTKDQIEEIFIVTSKMKATVIRSHTLGSSNGHPKSLTPTSSTGFNNAAWDPIDYSFFIAKKYGIKLIIPLCDVYEYFHGSYGFFCKNRGVDKTKFWSDRNVINDFKAYITAYLNHVNPYTGVAIKDSPEIAMIELGNELGNIRPTAGSTSIPTESWTREITQHIKSIDKTHLVLDGCDEALSKSGSFNVKEIDVYTGHFYWLERDRIEYGANTSANLGKPYIIGEYSSKFGSDWYSYIESRPNIKGSIMWCLYCHEGGYCSGAKVPHNDGFTLHYPEDSKELLLLTNHFRRMRGMSVVNNLEL
jgi:chitinase